MLPTARRGSSCSSSIAVNDSVSRADRVWRTDASVQLQAGGAGNRRRRRRNNGIEDDPSGNQRMRILQTCVCGLLALAPAAWGAGATSWEMNSYQDFIRGRFQGLSLTRDGQLKVAPKVDTLFTSDQPIVWSMARGREGAVYAATGHKGRLYEIDKCVNSRLLWTAEQPEIFAITTDAAGVLYAGTSPHGKVYLIVQGKASEYFAPDATYIWSLAVGPDGALYVGTGDQGKIFRVTSAGKGEVYYETGQAHVTSLALDREGRLLAGSEPNGILYRVTAKDKAFVLYDANLPEIRSIVTAPDGTIYAAALGGSVRRAQGAAPAAQAAAAAASAATPITTITLTPDRKVPLVTQTNESEATRLLASGGQILAATGNLGKIYRLGDQPGASGTYEAPVHDSGSVAHWGRLSWRAEGGSVEFRTRTG